MENIHTIEKEIKGQEWADALDEAFKKARKNTVIDGFRKGSVPKNIFLNKFGIESLYSDAIDSLIDKVCYGVVKDSNLIPVIKPTINIKEVNEEKVVFEVVITTRPTVTLGAYKDLKVKKEKVKVSEEEIDAEVKKLTDKYAEIVVKEVGKVENGNTAVIDFKGYVDGEELKGGSGENYPLEIGSHTFIPGFEDGIVGMSVGEEKELNLKFPENYTEELKNKDVLFKVKLNEIKERVLPELNKEFYEDLGFEDVNSIEEFRNEIKKHLENEKQIDVENKYIEDCLEKALENTKMELSEDIILDETDRMLEQIGEQLKHQGITLEQFLEFTHKNREDLIKEMSPEAEKRVKLRFMIEEVANVENIEISDEQAQEDATKMAEHYGLTKEELIQEFGGIENIKYDSRMRKAMEIIKG